MLALVAGYLWYQNYVETSPAIPFSELPIEKQQDFRAAMKNGDEAWEFFEREQLGDALGTATLSCTPKRTKSIRVIAKRSLRSGRPPTRC